MGLSFVYLVGKTYNYRDEITMIQQRENGLTDEIFFSFRYGIQSEELANEICLELIKGNIIYELISPSKLSKWKTVILIDNTSFDPYLIKNINTKFNLPINSFDFFFGITSRFQLGGFTLPSKIVDYVSIIGGEVQFSYSISFDEDD